MMKEKEFIIIRHPPSVNRNVEKAEETLCLNEKVDSL